jgi:hypothetical protein
MSPTLIQTYIAMANSIGIVMQNAASNQKNGQIISTTSTTVACTLIFQKGTSGS